MAEPGRLPLAGNTPTPPHRLDEDREGAPAPGGVRLPADARRPAVTSRLLGGLTSARTFESLQDRDFRWFFVATLGLNATMNMQMLARGYLVFELTGSYAALGTMALFLSVVMLGFSLYGGVLADRRSKRLVVQVGQIGSAVTSAAVAVLLFADQLRYEHLLIAAMAQGATGGLIFPALQSMPAEIVGLSRLQNAIALNMAGMNTMRLFGPMLGGVMLAIVGAEWVYVLMTALFLLSVVLLLRVPKREPDPAAAGTRGGIEELREGLAYILRTPTMFLLLALSFATSFLGMPYIRLLPGFVADVLDGGAAQLGLMMSVAGIGSLVGVLALASLPPGQRGKLLLLSVVVAGLGLTAFSASSNYLLSLALMVVVGLGEAGRQVLNNVLLHTHVEDAYRGRVSSVFMMQVGTMALGAFAVGLIAEFVGPQVGLGSFSLLLVVVALVIYAFVPRLRDLE